MLPLTATFPPEIAGDLISTGGQPPGERAVVFEPSLESVDQGADWSLAHATDAVEFEIPPGKSQHGGQESNGRSTVANEEVLVAIGEITASAVDRQLALAEISFNFDANFLQAVDHHARVVAVQCAAQDRSTIGKCRTDQRSVSDTF